MGRGRESRFYGTRQREGGFALLLTVTLVALLLALMVSLATLTRVETKISDNNVKQSQARRNALMALNVALGELQKYAGPDQRVTATAEAFGGIAGTKRYTGVWDTATLGTTPLVWLASGASGPNSSPDNPVELVGSGSAAANDVLASKQPITTNHVPGLPGSVTLGNYAWWVGDEGVKASIGLPDRAERLNYAPWDSAIQRRRIRQQIAGTPNYFRNVSGAQYGFDPFAVANASNVIAPSQIPLLTPSYSSMPVADFYRAYFHDLVPAAYGILANTRADIYRGLQRDLSLKPGELGNAFAAYADYASYMESPTAGASAMPPITSADSPRRRYVITPPMTRPSAAGLPDLACGVAPVLTDFLLQFKFNRTAANTVTVSCRLYVALWNPYTAALRPPSDLTVPRTDLTLEISGLPQVTISSSTDSRSFDLNSNLPPAIASAGKMQMSLPFTTSSSPDRASWLPGRQYAWVTPTGAGASGSMAFYNKNLNAAGWDYAATAPVAGVASDNNLAVSGPAVSRLVVTLKSGGSTLSTYTAPNYAAISQPASTTAWKFGFGFRLEQPVTTDTDRSWLLTFDPRADLGPPSLRSFDPNEEPGSNPNFFLSSGAPVTSQYLNAFLLYRTQGATISSLSAMNDVPIFELPRLPFLSVGELQHLRVVGERPFAIGNPWGGSANAVFDRFFFSGLFVSGAHPDLAAAEPLPNWNLRVLDTRVSPTTPWSIAAVRENDDISSSLFPFSSRFLLQGGAFNINSTSQPAWRAVLSGLRFPASAPFVRAAIDNTSGSVTLGAQVSAMPDTVSETFDQDMSLGLGIPSVAFLRYSQSAQETYFWVGDATSHSQTMSSQAFRMGLRASNPALAAAPLKGELTIGQIETLATSVADLVRTKVVLSGPFRSMEEFLSPNDAFGGKSLLEKAIDDAGLNPPELGATVPDPSQPGFGSLTLTQADIMSALAPYLRTRSDTFLVRTYGDVVNPVTGEVQSKAYLEAMVQRLPATLEISDDIAQPSLTGFGRRYKIVSLRWLSSSDI